MALLTAILPALIPAAADGVRAIINRVTGGAGAQPANVAELIQLMQADTERLRVVAQLDTPAGNISTWVANLRALQRPALATWILALYAIAIATTQPPETVAQLGQYAAMVVFYLFGDRGYAAIKGSR
jgi:hypothetical protein